MIVTPQIRGHRILKYMPRYISVEVFTEQEMNALSANLTDSLSQSNTNDVLGVYYTHEMSLMSRIWFLTQGIVYEINHMYLAIEYASIVKVDVKHEAKRNIRGLVITSTDDKEYFVPIQSNDNGTSDAFEILRYFNRVMTDLKTNIS
jgi:hypothetical protein